MNRFRHLIQSTSLLVLFTFAGCAELAYQHMNDPSRDAWQQPKVVIQTLNISPGGRVADLGAGGGYFTWPLAEAVGPDGIVYAVDINETGLRMIEQEAKTRNVSNVKPVLATPMGAKLSEPVDLVFICDTYHHMSDRVAYFRSLASHLRENGRVAILDFHKTGFFSGVLGHGVSKELVRQEMSEAGYRLVTEHSFLQDQHFQIFAARRP
jgi:predicted methyltransferase